MVTALRHRPALLVFHCLLGETSLSFYLILQIKMLPVSSSLSYTSGESQYFLSDKNVR